MKKVCPPRSYLSLGTQPWPLADRPSKLPDNIPWLFMYGSKDVACVPQLVTKTKSLIPQLKVVNMEGMGHWLQAEAKDDVVKEVVELVESAKKLV
jgi:soluble epoxide hydrolase / lipid-phosphate phosphatase